MENRIHDPSLLSASSNSNANYIQSRPTPRSNHPSYHRVPPPKPETRTTPAMYPPSFTMPPPPMHPNVLPSSYSSSMQSNVPLNPRAGMIGNKPLIGDRLERLAYSPPRMRTEGDRNALVEKLSGLLEYVEKW